MKKNHLGIVPIVESESYHRLIGIVTERDLCLNVIAHGLDPNVVPVDYCMTTSTATTEPEDNVQKAIALTRNSHLRQVLVVNERGILQGMVTTADTVIPTSARNFEVITVYTL
jgi:CBS domain-containing protein